MDNEPNFNELPGADASGVVVGDCRTVLPKIAEATFHAAVADIPYGIGLDDWDVLHANTNAALGGESPAQARAGKVFARRGKPINGWSQADRKIPKEYEDWCSEWSPELYRVLKPGASAFVFAGRRFAHRAMCSLEDAGFNVRDILGWIRPAAPHRAQRLSVVLERRGLTNEAEEWDGWRLGNLRPIYEPIIWCFKPYRLTVTDNVIEHGVGAFNTDAFEARFGRPDNLLEAGYGERDARLHPAQKPISLIEGLVELVTQPGQRVLDPFAGSGTTGAACQALDREYCMIENDPAIAEVARDRLRSGQAALVLQN